MNVHKQNPHKVRIFCISLLGFVFGVFSETEVSVEKKSDRVFLVQGKWN